MIKVNPEQTDTQVSTREILTNDRLLALAVHRLIKNFGGNIDELHRIADRAADIFRQNSDKYKSASAINFSQERFPARSLNLVVSTSDKAEITQLTSGLRLSSEDIANAISRVLRVCQNDPARVHVLADAAFSTYRIDR